MNCDTGHLVREMTAAMDGYTPLPETLHRAASAKLAGQQEAMVSLHSGGKLSNFASMTRNQRRNARKKLSK